jgi:class 3 adenylate cyclase/CHASE2 domain-containing sensor protein
MASKPRSYTPFVVAGCVTILVCLLQFVSEKTQITEFFKRLEWISYDVRLRWVDSNRSLEDRAKRAEGLAAVVISENDVRDFNWGYFGRDKRYVIPWPRFIYGRLARELASQGATAIGFDILFQEEHPPSIIDNLEDEPQESDQVFGEIISEIGNVVLAAAPPNMLPIERFRTNSWAIGSVYSKPDDGMLRRVKPFIYVTNRVWHPEILDRKDAMEFDLESAATQDTPEGRKELRFKSRLSTGLGQFFTVPLSSDGSIDYEEAVWDATGEDPEMPYTDEPNRVWQLGIVMAAKALGLELDKAEMTKQSVILRGNGEIREIPLDHEGYLYINWGIQLEDIRHPQKSIPVLITQDIGRNNLNRPKDETFKDKLVIIGSAVTGNNLSDQGATPLNDQTLLITKHFNVASSVMIGDFITVYSYQAHLFMILIMGGISALLTWRMRALASSIAVAFILLSYLGIASYLMIQHLYWLPIVLPMVGALLITHLSMITYRVVFEQKEQRRIRTAFSKLVAPSVVNEVLQAKDLNLGGALREVTVFFADVRGFTQMTDEMQADAERYISRNKLPEAEAVRYRNDSSQRVMDTINFYLSCVANEIKSHQGTLDKYMGDCVMAFWGAPTPNAQHATACVKAAIKAQRSIHKANILRAAKNEQREAENIHRDQKGLPPLEPLALMSLGTGINTGKATVGFMGSEEHIRNYTVFGREVNVASRLEGVSGKGHIVIGATTYEHLERDAPEIAARCKILLPVTVKGISAPVEIYEVPWQDDDQSNDL